MRIYLDFDADESYTPTRIAFLAGTGYHDLIQFATLEFTQPKGWISVSLDGVGGGKEGNVLRCHLLQVQIVENHQNGKDTHVRGLKIYARDERAPGRVARWEEGNAEDGGGERRRARASRSPVKGAERATVLAEPDWMGEPELR
jgi:anaphase-promoting complex subunit 10